ncbi:GTP cyclohydrolase I [Frankia sp. AiPs1]|uniref:GTP cyclohydrolase I n=1 Tax=Frankia sp. AiPs1 TaxID=573493 RepID=UPI0020434443|nr:GTP cyclohydrolase I FolE [Frankia sp. AiPs1]MCM3920308.1 GTP cyclohydrolase I [Frankia sp. AiPs1]
MTSTSIADPTAPECSAAPTLSVPAPCIDTGRVSDLIAQLLVALGENPAREGLSGTPERVASWWNTFLSPDSAATATCFAESHVNGELVVVGGMSVWSLCEHHLLPMNLQVTAGYVPAGQLLGLSKFGRIAQRHAGRLQVQERFTRQVADELASVIGSDDVAVAVRGTHLCMSMRGVRMEAARTRSLCARGRFQSDPVLSQQFLALAHPHTHPE